MCVMCYNIFIGTLCVEGGIFMFGIMRRKNREVRDRTVYMEVYGDNKVAYRVVSGRIDLFGDEVSTYGVEAEDFTSGEKEGIPDFSRNIEDAVDFAEMLISGRVKPRQVYNKALNYLCVSI